MIHIDKELKDHIIEQAISKQRTIKSLSAEYGISKSTLSRWIKAYHDEAYQDEAKEKIIKAAEEAARLRAENEELKKENDFLKKAAAFFAKERQ